MPIKSLAAYVMDAFANDEDFRDTWVNHYRDSEDYSVGPESLHSVSHSDESKRGQWLRCLRGFYDTLGCLPSGAEHYLGSVTTESGESSSS